MSRNYNNYDDQDYERDSYREERPEDRLRERFERHRGGRPRDPYGNYQSIANEDRPRVPGEAETGCNPWMTRGTLAIVILFALFKGGIFKGAVSISRRGCTIVSTMSLTGVLLLIASAYLFEDNLNSSLGLATCGSLLCLVSVGGFLAVIVAGVSVVMDGGEILPDENLDDGLLGRFLGR